MNINFSTKHKFSRIFVNILSIFVILTMALTNRGFSVQAAQRVLPGDWDGRAVQKASVLLESDGYKMWYDGTAFHGQIQIGLATSEDGISWLKYTDNPVLTGGPEAWDSSGEHGPFVMKDNDQYKMWYEGSDGNIRQLGYATSSDGINWTKYEGNPVLQAGPEGFDNQVAGHGSVLFEDSLYKLWYHAIGDQGVIIAYATSPDGINWNKQGPALLGVPDGWDSLLWGPSVLKVDGGYWMWYSAAGAINPSIGLATSEDGATWTRVGDAPVIHMADNNIGDPHVIFDDGIFKMWFSNFSDGSIYYTESNDGVHWSDATSALAPGLLSPLEGWHDGSFGEVDRWSCAASGWSADPDDRDRDVQVRVLSDGEQVAEGVAQDYGEDMEANNICPGGTCRFTINLWDLISHDQEHQITVQAYDVESNAWWNLEGTPKSLTCQTHPRLTVSITDDWFRIEEFPAEAPLAISIYTSQNGDLLWEDNNRTTDANGFAFVGSWETEVDLKPGMYLTVSSGSVTRDIVLEPLLMFVFNTEADLLAGSAPSDRELWVGAGNDNSGCSMMVTSGPDGAWEANFASQPCDVTDDMWAAVQAFDVDGDATEANPGFPRGSHDYDTNAVPSWACNAGGWAFDPDDQSRLVPIRIISDGDVVTELSTNENGDRGYEAHLWKLITSYETHEITVQAYDQESDTWRTLENTPKALTCRTYDIYAYDPLTGNTQQITNLRDTDEYNPSWSPNGKKIAHDVVYPDGAHGIYITDVKTGTTTPLLGAESGGNDAVWSPNGKWIAFDRRWMGEPNLYMVPATGGTPILIRENGVSADWAPSGKRMVFQQPSDTSIRTVAVDGGDGGETVITASGANPAWSPDGNWIAYENNGDVWKVRVNVQGTTFSEPIQVTHLIAQEGQPTWSADSQTIVFAAGLDRDVDLWSVTSAGGDPTWLTGAWEFGDYDPTGAKDSSTIAYASFSPNGQAERSWISAYTYDLPAGSWSEGEHSYHFEAQWNGGNETSNEVSFNVSSDAQLYDGYALLRPGAVRAGVDCPAIDTIHPNQPTRFLAGYLTNTPMTYSQALAYFSSLTASAIWDVDQSATLAPHEIMPYRPDAWFQYVCGFTSP